MEQLIEKLLASTPHQLALIAIILLIATSGPVKRKVNSYLGRPSAKVEHIDGHAIVRLIEVSKVRMPENWEGWVKEVVDHKNKTVSGAIMLLKDSTALRLDKQDVAITVIDNKQDEAMRMLGKIEGILEGFERRRR